MGNAEPSQTALTAAAARAAHLIVDREPRIFADTLAARLLGDRAEELIAYHRRHGTHPVLSGARTQVICRGRYTEDALAGSDVTQYVVLGAGLDSFAYRDSRTDRVRVFEVDHPATQRHKRAALAAAGIEVPAGVMYVPADLADENAPALDECLLAAGLSRTEPALVSWLGVTMYLTPDAIGRTFAALARLAPGTQIIADYMLPEDMRDEAGRMYGKLVAAAAAERGEPWRSALAPEEMTRLAEAAGIDTGGHVGQRDAVPAHLWQRSDSLRPTELAMLFHGTVRAQAAPTPGSCGWHAPRR